MEETYIDYDKLYEDTFKEVFDTRFIEVKNYFLNPENEAKTERKLRDLEKTVRDEYTSLLLKKDRTNDYQLKSLIEAFEYRNEYKTQKVKNFLENEFTKINLSEIDDTEVDISKDKEVNVIIFLAKFTALKTLSVNISRVGYNTKTDDEVLRLIEFGDENRTPIDEFEQENYTKENYSEKNSTPRQVLAMYYLFEELGLNKVPRIESAKIRFIEFLTGKNSSAIKELLKNPLGNKKPVGKSEDFRIIAKLFVDLKHDSLIEKINKDKRNNTIQEHKIK